MKKIIVSAMFLLSVSFGVMAQTQETNDKQINAAFHNDFAGATGEVWQKEAYFSKVTFSLNGSVLYAYYKPGGELIATSRNITSSQLPLHLLAELKNEYNSYWITDLFEMSVNGNSEYYVTLENATEKRILFANDFSWEVFDTVNKEY
jgi:hypothetical protein